MNQKQTQMTSRTGTQCGKSLDVLFKDDVFVDFFNTFLNLPVFGQTPLWLPCENQWYFCPEIPCIQDVRSGSFLEWLKVHRFSFFKQTELYHHYTLCQELLQYASSQDVRNWTLADQWLLRRCLGSVRGMRHFSAFLQGTGGEELVMFFVRVNCLLQINWRKDRIQKNVYQALLTVIKLLHLTEGSPVMATCHISYEDFLQINSVTEPSGMKHQVLDQMKSKALCRLQSYWLPKFFSYCKVSITQVTECVSIAKEYEDRASCLTPVERPAPSDPRRWSLGTPPTEGAAVTRVYCSKARKRQLWKGHQRPGKRGRVVAEEPDEVGALQWLPMPDGGDEDKRGGRGHRKFRNHREEGWMRGSLLVGKCPVPPPITSHSSDLSVTPHACIKTPICHLPSVSSTSALRPTPPSGQPRRSPQYDEHLSLALSADALAGGPYENYLRGSGQEVMLHNLGLWQELDGFLHLLLYMELGPSKALRQMLAEKIMTVYLTDSWKCTGRPEGERRRTYLTKSTVSNLVTLLPSGDVLPWIYTAKQELCPIFSPTYNTFLDEEDKHLLLYLFARIEVKGKVSHETAATSSGPGAPEQQVRRMREALALCQACIEPLTEETWALVPLEEVRRGGSIHLNYKKIVGTTEKPEVASSSQAQQSLNLQKAKEIYLPVAHRPTSRPTSIREVMKCPNNLTHFQNYLKTHHAYGALLFYQRVEKLRNVDSVIQGIKINSVVDTFFRRPDAEDYLQCRAYLISQIPKMRYVSSDVIFAAQDLVFKSLEATWFRKYCDTFPPHTYAVKPRTTLTGQPKIAWRVFSRFIKRIGHFLNSMKDSETRSKFETYLTKNWLDYSLKPTVKLLERRGIKSVGQGSDDSHLTRRVINNKLVTVEFLANDLSFFLETESFKNIADSATRMALEGMHGEIDDVFLHQKGELIIKLFLKSSLSPELNININESTRDSVHHNFSLGKVDRSLFHEAIMAIFPNLIFCWKKFCSQKVEEVGVCKEEDKAVPETKEFETVGCRKTKTIMTTEDDHSTLRFSLSEGLTLIFPYTRLQVKSHVSLLPLDPDPMGRRSSKVPSPELSNRRRTSLRPILSPQMSPSRSNSIIHLPP
ncbi:hypothetical protein DPEC_G00109340 [Dallia pectoralis]|uniref:Uncharacterized protein n=1 Tax=Dallia pectoralis TaxID=75939 RepID=A0ACC2GSJ8_DALPE|nr:hypothetical protein DPEC_G00109340 [Dallia pectoralis]